MSNKYTLDKWKQRLKLLYHLPFSNRSLKFFPPEFTFRDPMVSLLHKSRQESSHCGLIFLALDHCIKLIPGESLDQLIRLRACIKDILRQIVQADFTDEEVIGITRYQEDEICLYVRLEDDETFDDLYHKGLQLRNRLEQRIRASRMLSSDQHVRFLLGCYVIDPAIANTKYAAEVTYQYARLIATKQLPYNFGNTKLDLDALLKSENISVLAQPIMNLSNGDIFGWEILTRGPQGTPYHLPMDLFEIAHQADVLTALECVVFKKALSEISKRQIKEQVFINITSVSLCHPYLLNELLSVMAEFPEIHPKQIVLEITERHQIRDYEFMAQVIRSFRDEGFRFAVDDAGSGYSSLQSISELIPDIIKIDKSVIQNIDQAEVKQSMLKALLYFAEHMNCQVVAEGVEREEEADILYKHKVHMGQGYYFAKPAPLVFDYERGWYDRMKEKILLRRQTSSA